ncbi:hypothetical protein [Mycobacterium innocens]|nr:MULTISPECIES: hypothetical protein [Mycobacterium]
MTTEVGINEHGRVSRADKCRPQSRPSALRIKDKMLAAARRALGFPD